MTAWQTINVEEKARLDLIFASVFNSVQVADDFRFAVWLTDTDQPIEESYSSLLNEIRSKGYKVSHKGYLLMVSINSSNGSDRFHEDFKHWWTEYEAKKKVQHG